MGGVLKVLVNVLVAVLPIAAAILAVFGAAHLLRKYEDPERRARALKRAGMGVIAAFWLASDRIAHGSGAKHRTSGGGFGQTSVA